MQKQNGARLKSAVDKDSDAPLRENPPQPHPDDWPADISEPEFLELTKVYSGNEPRDKNAAAATEHAEPSPDRPVPGDDMQTYHSADDSAKEAILASEPADPTLNEPTHAPEDFISEPTAAESPDTSLVEPVGRKEAQPRNGEDADPYGPAFEDGPMNVHPGRAAAHSAGMADAAPTPEDFEHAYPAEKPRQGRIVLDEPERRALFFGGLVGIVIVALAMVLLETV